MSDTTVDMSHDDVTEEPLAPRAGWTVETEEQAAWAVDCILTARERLDRVTSQAALITTQVEAEVRRTEAFFEPLIEQWLRAHPPRKGRTVHLTTGDVSFRRVSGRVVIADVEKALLWARAVCPTAIRRKVIESVIADEVERHLRLLDDDAPLPPGIAIQGEADRFYVTAPKGKK